MKFHATFFLATIGMLTILFSSTSSAQSKSPFIGRWDMVISQGGKELPSWLEVTLSGNSTLIGRFVYAFGSARPISEVKVKDGKFNFSIPVQWESGDRNMEFEGQLDGDNLKGTMLYTDGKKYSWKASRAPLLHSNEAIVWGAPELLFNGENLEGWSAMGANQWIVEAGELKSPKSGANLVSDKKFKNFKLHIEFKYPEGSNSGVYLRGRHEVQIEDNKGLEPSSTYFGGVYGFLTPNEMVAKGPGEWQAYDITLNGRRVSIVANGKPIITDQIIPGITGGAIDSKEGESGPILIQGDHGPIAYRNIVITPEFSEE